MVFNAVSVTCRCSTTALLLIVVDTMNHSNVEFCQLAYDGNTNVLKEKMSANAGLVNKTDQDGRTALHWASSAGKADVVDILLANNAKV